MSQGDIVKAFSDEARLKRNVRRHFTRLGFTRTNDGSLVLPAGGKETVRQLHSEQKAAKLKEAGPFLKRALPILLPHFAEGAEIDPARVQLRLKRVTAGTEDADLFRLATLIWSVPVSNGFGRRLRYLVWDEGHARLAGVIALGDPVFNLSVRDHLIGWNTSDRSQRLVNILDAYVLGAVPPYNMLLCGKAVACLVRSREVVDDFAATYGNTVGIISGKAKKASLLAVTTTSSMGRSSIYNRLKLGGTEYFRSIGYTLGWGHFHITDKLFEEMRAYLRQNEHRYADQHRFGQGPNWRLRTIRAALSKLEMNESVLRHGIKREVFLCTLSSNATELLRTGRGHPDFSALTSVAEISDMARERWIVPRAERAPNYLEWKRHQIAELLGRSVTGARAQKIRREQRA